ncbi:hypothetical protein NPIL_644671 [Nephila pilipes]|uniref:Methyltransferase domain-containing protein n=1 Tax=Nephila pilipes TaxID=299642 RepID=A0A8X6NB51_NEPPI|nr:hypothetical protein NPIL_644671 [Nephila pilipes]
MNFLVDSSCRAIHVTNMDTFYDRAIDVLKLESLQKSIVLDIGCGLGHSSMKLLKLFPSIERIIGIDKDIDVVLKSREVVSDTKIVIQLGDIELGSGLHQYKNKVSALFSTHCFGYLENPNAAFQNVYELLEDGGRAALLFFRKSLYRSFIIMLRTHPILKTMLMDDGLVFSEYSPITYTPSEYADILRNIGFKIEGCEEVVKCREYASVEEYKGYIASSIRLKHEATIEKFYLMKKAILEVYMAQYSEISDRNLPCFKEVFLQVFISKPKDCEVEKLYFPKEMRLSAKDNAGSDEEQMLF